MSKRLLAILLCTMLVLSMVAGCASQQPAATPTPAPAKTEAPSPDDTAPAVVEKKEVTISWSGSMDPAGDDLGKWMMETFKIKLNMVMIDSVEKVKMLAASDSLPDLIGGMGLGDATYSQLKADGMIRDIPDEMLEGYPLLKKTIDEHPILPEMKVSTGKNYWLPVWGDADNPKKATCMPYYYRADWAKKLGIATPTTVDELYVMLKAFTEQDPDGNGQNDTYGMTGWLWQVHFITWVDMYAWVKEDGKWIPGIVSKNMLPALKFYNKLYQEKILDPEFANANGKNMFMQDKVGVMSANSTAWHVWNNIYKSFAGTPHSGVTMTPEEAMEAVQFLPPLKATADSPPMYAQSMDVWGNAISANTSDEVLDRILEIANWQLTPDGRDMMTYGFLDKDWIIKDGKAVSIMPNNLTTGTQKKIWDLYPSVGGWTICEGYRYAGTPWLNPSLPQDCYDREDQWEAMAAPAVFKSNITIDNLSTPLKDKCSVAPAGATEADFQRIIASADVEAEYNALVESWMNAQGLAAAIDEVNAVIAQQGLDK